MSHTPSSSTPAGNAFRPPVVPSIRMGGFWGERIDAVAGQTAHIIYERCVAAGMFDQIDPDRPVPAVRMPFHRRADGTPDTVNVQMFWDSDVAKVIETAAYSLYRRADPVLEEKIDAIVEMFRKLQEPDGYLNSWFIRMQPGGRWTNLRDCHELYCAGHLMEAAVAYFHSTGKRTLLDVLCRYADHIDRHFGPNDGQLRGYCGHEEIELALVRLFRATGERRYLNLAKYFIDERGRQPHYFDQEAAARGADPAQFRHGTYEYNQSHKPVREQERVVGHAVRAMYLYSGMADIAAEFGDDTLTDTLDTLWDDLTEKQMYVTGGIGPAASNEGFTADYDLPNESAYAETCASVGVMMWSSRMLGRGPDRRYTDVMERALYNGTLSGLSIDGSRFFYDNPLASRGGHHRWQWHRCPCCPPNVGRTVAAIGTYFYGVSDREIAVHLYGESTAELTVAGTRVVVEQRTDYPWDGTVRLTVTPDRATRFALLVRVPGWAHGASLDLNGERQDETALTSGGYYRIEREWQAGDALVLELPMPLRALRAHPKVLADRGRVALARGPLVYCAEATDNGEDLAGLVVPADLTEARTTTAQGLGQAVAMEVPLLRETWTGITDALYREEAPALETVDARLVPYYLWDNREAGPMMVWMRAAT